jgi:hypothetical protein
MYPKWRGVVNMKLTLDKNGVVKDGKTFVYESIACTLDGHRIHAVQEADDVEGYITAPLLNLNDKRFHFDQVKEDYTIVKKFGKVQIFIDDPFYTRMDREEREPKNSPWRTLDASYPFSTSLPVGASIPGSSPGSNPSPSP